MPVIANSSPLIYLAALSDFHFLRDLFTKVMIPPGVYDEVVKQGTGFPVKREVEIALNDWLVIGSIQNRQRVKEICEVGLLDLGEAEAIVLAQECRADQLLMDDQRGVSCARASGLTVTRTPLIYAEAKLRGWIPTVQEKLDALRENGFRLKDQHYRLVLAKLGEL